MRNLHLMLGLGLVAACGSDDGDNGRGQGDGGLVTVGAEGTADGGSQSATQGGDSGGVSMSGGGTGGDTAGADTAGSAGDGTADGVPSELPKFDVGSPDGGASCGGGLGGAPAHSNIWIANSSQGTVSKINTQTMVEEGRYIVKPNSAGSPSRTTVSLSANVAIANRNGGVAKIYANIDDCVDSNGTPGIQTSAGGADILPWGEEECVAWYTPLLYSSNRPMAWAQGDFNSSTCAYENEKLWTGGANGVGTTEVLLLDGETGVVEQTIPIPQVGSSIGLYGGAVDGDGHFWGIDTAGARQLVRVDRDDFSVQIWPGPGSGYGLAVDSEGRPWFCSGGGASRFDPLSATWQSLPSPGGNAWGGCMTDGAGTLWHCRQQDATLVGIDTETLNVVQQIPLPAYAHGISVDFDGYVWAVGFASTQAFRVDPGTGSIDTFSDLVGAYSYSDMTGFALSSAGVPSG